MRILYLTEEAISFTDAMVRGGAIHVRNVVEGLRNRGHDVFLVDWNDSPERPYQQSLPPQTRFIIDPMRTFRKAVSIGRAKQVDVIVSKTRKTYLPGLAAARRLGVPHVVHVGSSLDRLSAGPLEWVDVASLATRLRAPHDAYVVVCEHITKQLRDRRIAAERIFNVGNAVNTERFHPDYIPEPLNDRYRDQIEWNDAFTLGYVGGLQPYKGLDDLAMALHRIDGGYRLVVAGDGPDRQQLERAFGDCGTFLGAVPYEQIPALYHEFDAFVLPSRTEGLPRVVLEAQATATPVVATQVGGVPEIVADGETGLLCDAGDPGALAVVIQRLAGDPELRTRLARGGRNQVVDAFTWDALLDRYERFLGDVTGDPAVTSTDEG